MLSAKWPNDRDALVTEALSGPDVREGQEGEVQGGQWKHPRGLWGLRAP